MNPEAHQIWTAPRWALAALLALLGMLGPFSIDTYIPAFSGIATAIGATPVEMQQTLSAYLFGFAFMNLFHGALADSFGRRPVVLCGIAVFTLASAGCALALSLPMLVATRVLQGVGGAMMVPVGRLVVIRTTRKTDLVTAIAYLTWPALVAPLVAPALGGLLSTYTSWRWIFLINVPLGLAGLVLARRLVPDVRLDDAGPLDWRGFLLAAAGVAALVVGLENVAAPHPRWPFAIGALLVAAAGLAGTAAYLLRVRRPLLDLRELRVRTYRVTALGGSIFRAVITAIPFLLPLFFQLGFGWSAAHAGLVVIALFAGNIGIKPVTTPLMRRYGIRTVMLGAVAASAGCLVGMAFLHRTTPLPVLLALLVLSGIARSAGFTAYNTVAFADIPADRMTSANTLMSAVQELGAGLGVAVGALLVRLGEPVGGVLGLGDGAGAPFRVAFVVLAIILAGPAADAFTLPRTAGNVVAGRE
jgi:MFS family permease